MTDTYEVHYSEEQLTQAAKFIFMNNPSCRTWPVPCHSVEAVRQHIMDNITQHGKRCANVLRNSLDPDRDWPWMTGTGGYYLIFTNDDDSNVIFVEILVDPAVARRDWRYIVDYVEMED